MVVVMVVVRVRVMVMVSLLWSRLRSSLFRPSGVSSEA